MASHLIYIPTAHKSGLTVAEQLAAVGLADHAQGAQTVPANNNGPDDGGGMLYGWNATNGRLHFDAAEQTWIPAAVDPVRELPMRRYWVGVWKNAEPTERDLRRPGTLYGGNVTLGNGEPWMVPCPSFLPHDLILRDDGSFAMEPQRRYQQVCHEASIWELRMNSADRHMIDYGDLYRFVMLCLGLNYRLPPELASHMRLIDTENVATVFRVAVNGEA